MYYLGIDPDLHTTAFALIDETKRVVGVEVVRQDSKLHMARGMWRVNDWLTHAIGDTNQTSHSVVAVVEGQECYTGPGRHATPADLIDLAFVAGSCAYNCYASRMVKDVLNPLPKKWKGTIPKKIHHEHICNKMGWAYEERKDYLIPIELRDRFKYQGIKNDDWKHLMDAIGMALWAQST